MGELLKSEQEYEFLYSKQIDLIRFRCQNNAKKNGLNCPMFTARYLNQNYNFCSDCDHVDVSK